MAASDVSAIPAVRAFLLDTQRDIARRNSVVMDGRDIGTVILPDADVKIFLVASTEARAERRTRELEKKGMPASYEDVLREMRERDAQDSGRAIAPAIPAPDAIHLDNSSMTSEESVAAVMDIIAKKTGESAV
jgi:cytidylate kinase